MTFEGGFYYVANGDCRGWEEQFNELPDGHGLCCELGDTWNLILVER